VPAIGGAARVPHALRDAQRATPSCPRARPARPSPATGPEGSFSANRFPRVLLICIFPPAAKGPPMACLREPPGDPSWSAVFGAGARRRNTGLRLCVDTRQTMPAPATTWAGC